MMEKTIFDRIAAGEMDVELLYEDADVLAFRDINPQAPTHILIIPRKPLRTLNEATPEDAPLLGRLLLVAARLASEQGIAEMGYRTVLNCNAAGGQTVNYLHVHLLGGRPMQWPPG